MPSPLQPPPGPEERAREFILANTRVLSPPLCPEVSLHQVDALSELWQAGESALGALGVDVPFWAAAWPGGQALARFVLDTPGCVRGASVLDLGTGSGICAIAAAMAGAGRVQAVDPDPVAVVAVRLNARLNDARVEALVADLLERDPPAGVDVILAADLWYERWMALRVTPWLRAAAARGIRVLGADPGRAYLPRGGLVEVERHEVPTSLDLEREAMTTTRVFTLLGHAGAGCRPAPM